MPVATTDPSMIAPTPPVENALDSLMYGDFSIVAPGFNLKYTPPMVASLGSVGVVVPRLNPVKPFIKIPSIITPLSR